MVTELTPLDITDLPELARLADEVARTRRPRALRRGDTIVAVLMPPPTSLDEGYQAIPALDPPRSWDDMIEIAAEELAQSGARPRRAGTAGHVRGTRGIAERTAGALKRYAKQPPATREEEKEAFAQAVADEVAGHLGT